MAETVAIYLANLTLTQLLTELAVYAIKTVAFSVVMNANTLPRKPAA